MVGRHRCVDDKDDREDNVLGGDGNEETRGQGHVALHALAALAEE